MDIQHIVLIILILVLIYFTFKNINNEFFTNLIPKIEKQPVSYPISFQQNVVVNSEDQSMNNDKYFYILRILKQVKQLGNSGYNEPLVFNAPNLPITNTVLKKDDIMKLYPIINYIITTMNKLGNGNDVFVFIDSKHAVKDEIENQLRLRFEIICGYKKKINETYFDGKKKEVIADIGNLIIDTEIVIQKDDIDDIFAKNFDKLDKLYINIIRLNGFGSDDMLPGKNVDDYTTYFYYNPDYTNIIVDKKLLENKQETDKK
jgi:hypothetical protein